MTSFYLWQGTKLYEYDVYMFQETKSVTDNFDYIFLVNNILRQTLSDLHMNFRVPDVHKSRGNVKQGGQCL